MEHSDFIFNGKDNEFTRLELDLIFSSCKGLTLGQLDSWTGSMSFIGLSAIQRLPG